jgi:hypothetical protein
MSHYTYPRLSESAIKVFFSTHQELLKDFSVEIFDSMYEWDDNRYVTYLGRRNMSIKGKGFNKIKESLLKTFGQAQFDNDRIEAAIIWHFDSLED